MTSRATQSGLTLRFAAAVLLAMAIALAVFYLLMQPQQADLAYMTLFLTITSGVTLAAGYLAYRSGWIRRAPGLRVALLATYVLSSALTFFNVWLTARLMFVSQHDLLLATILLLFASGIAVALGSFFSEALAHRIQTLNQAVRELRVRGLGVRAEVEGEDEIAQLARAFNQMAAELQAADQRRRTLDRLRRDLIVWVSHDLQTPLASIRAIVEALADDVVEDPETARRYLQTAKREVRALSSLIDDLFEMAQLDAGGIELDLQPIALSDLVSDTLESFSALAADGGITLTGEVDSDVDPVPMDVGRVGRVLNNLLSNAIRHTPPGGDIRVFARRRGGHVEVEVRDNGDGFTAEELPHIFERFYRGEKSRSRATGGAGLGLAIAKGFVEAHGGEIRAEHAGGGGARFLFTLPYRPSGESGRAAASG